jgi:hypothetical protein
MKTKQADLKILCSIRVRLNADERQALKDAYRRKQQEHQTPPQPLVNRGSGITVQHSQVQSDINTRLGLPHIVIVDLLSSRDAISLPTLLLFQQELGVEIVNQKQLTNAFQDYLVHVESSVVPAMGLAR